MAGQSYSKTRTLDQEWNTVRGGTAAGGLVRREQVGTQVKPMFFPNICYGGVEEPGFQGWLNMGSGTWVVQPRFEQLLGTKSCSNSGSDPGLQLGLNSGLNVGLKPEFNLRSNLGLTQVATWLRLEPRFEPWLEPRFGTQV